MFPHRVPRRDVDAWSETIWYGCHHEADDVGLFVHAGRYRDDVDLWWVQSVAYLPDGTLAVDRSWAQSPDQWTLTSPVSTLRGRADGSAVSLFRGAPERLTTEQLAQHPGGSGSSVTMEWELDLTPARDPWVMGGHGVEWGDAHTQQQYAARGSLTVDGRTWSLDGPGWGDHSSGVRTWDGFGSHVFVNLPAEKDGIVLIGVRMPDGSPAMTVGSVLDGQAGSDPVVSTEGGWLTSLLGAPHAFDLSVTTESGRTVTYQVEVLHTLPATISELNDNVNGLDWRGPGDPLFLAECLARFTAPDGTVLYGHLERSTKRSAVDPQTFDVRPA